MMKKKYYIPLLWLGALLWFSVLPISNYVTDQWRVLHGDYKTSYKGISPNKTFLKVAYLLDNKDKYETILMGSSRSGYMDARLIDDHAYNMKFNFALVGMHLHNLKTLLNNKVNIKTLWIGINDYTIWKDPLDHELDYQRKLYKDDIWHQWDTYIFYLLKQIHTKDIKILEGKYALVPTEELTNPDKGNIETAKLREDYALSHKAFWLDKMTKIKPTLLGYKDDTYRIDEVISEIQEIKKICEDNGIALTFFMYPSFYKTYLSFNQYKIEAFKKKLASISDFYDFYGLNTISLDEFKWQDSSHFHLSVGNSMIENIHNNKFLVTSENVHKRIQKTRGMISNLLKKDLGIKYLYAFNIHMDLSNLKTIFELKNSHAKFYKNNHFTLENKKDFITLGVNNIDPIIILDPIEAKSNNVILRCQIESSQDTVFQIYYKKDKDIEYNELNALRIKLHKGINEFNVLIPSVYIRNHLRVDIADKIGEYRMYDFSILSLR